MHTITHRRKGQRRSYLKRFMSDTVHIHQAPLRAREEGVTKHIEHTLVPDGKGEPTKHDPEGLYSVHSRKVTRSHEGVYDTFALKARNTAAQQTHRQLVYRDNKGEWKQDDGKGKMSLPVLRDLNTGEVYLDRVDGPNEIPRAVVLFRLWQGTRRQGQTEYNSIVIDNGKWNTVRYFFGGDEHFIMEEKRMTNMVRWSVPYRTRGLLFQAHYNMMLIWEATQKLNP